MEHKTDRRQAVKTLGGLLVAGTALAVPRKASAQPRPSQAEAPTTRAPLGQTTDNTTRVAEVAPAAPEPVIPCRGGEPPPPQLTPKQLQLDPLKRLVSPHREGSTVGTARLTSVQGVHLGAASLTFKSRRGVTFQVDICKRDRGVGAFTPIASSGLYDLFVVNGGRGYKATDRQLLDTVNQLASTITANEPRVKVRVMTLRQRLRQHPGGKFDVRSAPQT